MSPRFALLLHAFCNAERQSDQTVQSSATCLTTFGRCTFTATTSPLQSVAWYTCPSDAAATGEAPKLAKSGFVNGSAHVSFDACPGASGPSKARSSAIARHAISSGNGAFSICRLLSASAASSPIKSGRCDRVWPIFTKTGPRPLSASRSAAPRVRADGSSFSSLRHRRTTPAPTRITAASLVATEPGLRLKNARSFFLSNPPRNASYGSGFFRRLVFSFRRDSSRRETSVFDSRLASALDALDAAFRRLASAFFASFARRSAMISSSVSAGSPRARRSKLRKRSRLRGRVGEEAFASTRREEDPVPSSTTRGGSDEAEEEGGPPPEVDATTLARSSTAVSSRLESKEEASSS